MECQDCGIGIEGPVPDGMDHFVEDGDVVTWVQWTIRQNEGKYPTCVNCAEIRATDAVRSSFRTRRAEARANESA